MYFDWPADRTQTMRSYIFISIFLAAQAGAQETGERWNLYFQATSIGQYHGAFRSPYSGTNSLAGHREAEASLTSTVFLGLRLFRNTQLYFDPEVAGGGGLRGGHRLANETNREMARVGSATPQA